MLIDYRHPRESGGPGQAARSGGPGFPLPRRTVQGTEAGCAESLLNNHRYPVAGLVPATHVFFRREIGSGKDVDGRDKPGHGGFFDATTVRGCRNSIVGISPDSPALSRE